MPRLLEGPELGAYDVVPMRLARRVWIVRWRWLPPGAAAMTLGRIVLVRGDDDRTGRRALLAHELVHVAQWEAAGVVRFLTAYLRDYARGLWRLRRHRAAYLAIPAEVEARRVAADWARRRTT